MCTYPQVFSVDFSTIKNRNSSWSKVTFDKAFDKTRDAANW